MTERTRTQQLRELAAKAEGIAETGFEPVALVDPGTLTALLDIADAAQDFIADCGACNGGVTLDDYPNSECPICGRLRDALNQLGD